jgi:lipopolysaccharide biosynthesis glycosyltransferase
MEDGDDIETSPRDKQQKYRISGGILALHGKGRNDLDITIDEKLAFQETMDEFIEEVSDLVDFNTLNVYQNNVEWSGKLIDEDIEFEFEKWGNGIWQRWKDEKLIKGDWDKLLIVDADTMVRWDAPNIFEQYKDKNFCAVRDAGGHGTGLYHLNQWTKVNQNIKTPPQNYFNCGFLFMNKQNYLKLSIMQ